MKYVLCSNKKTKLDYFFAFLYLCFWFVVLCCGLAYSAQNNNLKYLHPGHVACEVAGCDSFNMEFKLK